MAKATYTESRLANYQCINENALITAKANTLGLNLCQAHHCHDKTKSYIISAKIGEPGLLYTKLLTDVEEFLKSHESKQLASKQTATRKVPEDTQSDEAEEASTEEYDDEIEE